MPVILHPIVMPPKGGAIKGYVAKFHKKTMKMVPVLEKKVGGRLFYKLHPHVNHKIVKVIKEDKKISKK